MSNKLLGSLHPNEMPPEMGATLEIPAETRGAGLCQPGQ